MCLGDLREVLSVIDLPANTQKARFLAEYSDSLLLGVSSVASLFIVVGVPPLEFLPLQAPSHWA